MNTLPASFIQINRETFGEEGERWLHQLPELLSEYAERWSLTIHPHFPGLSYNYAAPVTLADGQAAVLKAGVDCDGLLAEIQALRFYNGQGMVRLLREDADRGVMLLERIQPGTMLTTLPDDEATQIAAEVMAQIFHPLPIDHPFASVAKWAKGLERSRLHFDGGTGPLPQHWVEMAEGLFADLLASSGPSVLIHGDLHHYNILAGQHGWTAIDPKGMAGEAPYEVGALLRNPLDAYTWPDLPKIQARRIAILSERLGFDRQRLVCWGIAQAVLSAWWTIEDGGTDWQPAIRCAETLVPLL
jgi:streptomycin 6-kinase